MRKLVEKHPKDVNRIRKVLKFFVIALPIVITLRLLVDREDLSGILSAIIMYPILFCVYYGVKNVKSWAVNLILIISAISIISTIQAILVGISLSPVEGTISLIFQILILYFYLYMMIVFIRPSTREFFGEKGVTVI